MTSAPCAATGRHSGGACSRGDPLIRRFAYAEGSTFGQGTSVSRILVAYDDSPSARRALAEAVRLARVEGARLIAVAVAEHPPAFDGASLGEVREDHERRQRACRLWLRAAEAYADEHGVQLRTDIRSGSFAQQLARAAAIHQAELVVIGRRSHPSLWRRLTGTKAEKTTRHLGCPILIAG
jgi:universal stress protein F